MFAGIDHTPRKPAPENRPVGVAFDSDRRLTLRDFVMNAKFETTEFHYQGAVAGAGEDISLGLPAGSGTAGR